jgi:tetratricopeptide (TPR) repeat protein
MAKKLNRNLIGVLTVVCMVLLAVAGFALLANLPGHDPKVYEADAKKFEAEEKYDMAAQTYVRAHQRDPQKNPEYLVSAAKCAMKDGKVGLARELIASARVRDTKLKSAAEFITELELEIAKLFGGSLQWNHVLTEAKKLAALEPESALANRALALSYSTLQSEDDSYKEKGQAALKKAIELDPSDADAVEAIVRQYWFEAITSRNKGQTAEAEASEKAASAVLTTAIDKSSKAEGDDSNRLKRLSAIYKVFRGEVDKGIAELEALASGEKGTLDARLVLADLYMGTSGIPFKIDLDKAEKVLQEAMKIDPKDGRPYRALGQVYKRRAVEIKDPAKMQAMMEQEAEVYRKGLEAVQKTKHFRSVRNNMDRVQFVKELFLQDLEQAKAAKRDKKPDTAELDAAEGWLTKLKDEIDAESLDVRFMTAALYEARGKYVQATREAEAASKLNGASNSVELQLLLADLYSQGQQFGASRKAMEQAVALRPAIPFLRLRLAQLLLQLNEPNAALGHLIPAEPQTLRDTLAKEPAAAKLRAEAYRQLGDYAKAEQELRTLGGSGSEPGESADDELRAVNILVDQQKYGDAETRLLALLQKSPDDAYAPQMLVRVYRLSDQLDKAREFLKAQRARFPDKKIFQQLELSLVPADSPDRDKLHLEYANSIKDPLQRSIALADYHLSKEDYASAIPHLDEAEKAGGGEAVLERQLRCALLSKDWERAERFVAKDASLNLDGTEGKIAQGRLAAAKGEYERAVDVMKVGLQKFPSNSMGWTYLAEAYMKLERKADAKMALTSALQANPSNGFANRGMASFALAEQDNVAARKYLEAVLRVQPDDRWAESQMQLMKEKESPEKGIAAREKSRIEHPDDFENLIFLARLYKEPKVAQYDKASEAYKDAMKACPQERKLDVARELASFMGSPEVNRPAEADAILSGMLRAENDKAKKALIAAYLGQFYEMQKVLATADRNFRLAVSLHKSPEILTLVGEFYARTNRYREAVKYYEEILGLADVSHDTAKETRSRIIALWLAIGDIDTAKKHIDSYLAAYPGDSQGMIYEGAYHRIGGDVQKAREAFDRHLEADPDNAVALWQRGQLHMLLGRWQNAADDLAKAKSFMPDGFGYQHRIALANCLVELQRADQAVSELQSILDKKPDEILVAEALMDVYCRVRPPRYGECERLIFTYMQRDPREPQWPAMLGKLGEITENWDKAVEGYMKAAELGRYRPALVRSYFNACRRAKRPQGVIAFATEKLSSRVLEKMPLEIASLAWAYFQIGDKDKAGETYDWALASAGADFLAYTRIIGDMVLTLGKEAVLESAKARAAAEPENVEKQKVLVHLYQMSGEPEKALETCARVEKLASREGDIVFALVGQGMLLENTGKFNEAKAKYEAALKVNPDQAIALNNLAYLLAERLNLPAEGLPYAKHAERANPGNADVLDTLGWLLFLNNRLGESAGTLLRALEANRENVPILYHLGLVHRKRGEAEEAKFRLKAALEAATAQGNKDYLPKITKELEELDKGG